MATETFDQRFKRLTSDMLMIDICRMLGIEIRDLMKIRSGIRIELPSSGLRRLCQEQGLDYTSFTADIEKPWSSELKPAEVITADEPARTPAMSASSDARPATKFRPDGSRLGAPPARAEQILTVNNETRRREAPVAMDYSDAVGAVADADSSGMRKSLADRFRDGLASAFKRIESELDGLPDEDEFVAATTREPARRVVDRTAQIHEIQSLVAEVTLMRRELNELSTNVRRLLIR